MCPSARRTWHSWRYAPALCKLGRRFCPHLRSLDQAFTWPTFFYPQSNGDEGRYWRVLSDAGINRARLEGFDRPIKTAPQFFSDKKVRYC